MKLVNFNFKDKEVRTINQDSELWFVAKDVAEILGYSQTSAMTRYLDNDELMNFVPAKLGDSNSKARKMKAINESGLYSSIIRSTIPQAKEFKKWVTNDVLPSIRKYGLYATDDVITQSIDNPDYIIGLLTEIKKSKLQLEQAQPLIEFANSIGTSVKSISFDTYAKLLANDGVDIGRNRLFALLREHGYLLKSGEDKNNPKQKYVEQGLFEVKESVAETVKGTIPTKKTLITGKGQIYFLNKIKELLAIDLSEVV